ncbi:hypothetical protein DFP74_1314 [Nocardiopsis sp. Huas11]|uniref:divisome protein SepX/GlpR n=1 Tax=Nocardiopsis sp. Huas11 TaxID=2183912 RepID=UPI000EB528D2|nr:hypothetical protein [Nocardiopsis sp. Huas11]RKS05708.1 hypothetical protein DFP74_1314 [Nocardiopsis sp. Huas11]
MSSSPLYLAIVVVWLIVLVPMLLRKDSADAYDHHREDEDTEDAEVQGEDMVGREAADAMGEAGDLDRTDGAEDRDADEERADEGGIGANERVEGSRADRPARTADPRRGRHRVGRESRGRVIARRRRRTSGLLLVTLATIVAVAFGLGPWWVIAPPALLLVGHLALLREAAKADAERREAIRRARRRAVVLARRVEEEEERRDAERLAQVIALQERRSQVYDQYADARLRAAGD